MIIITWRAHSLLDRAYLLFLKYLSKLNFNNIHTQSLMWFVIIMLITF